MTDTFPARLGATGRFTRGIPTAFTSTADGTRLRFLRSLDGTDRVNRLWEHQVQDASANERCLVDPTASGSRDASHTSAEERALRERVRQQSSGITTYSTDTSGELIAFTLGGLLYTFDARSEAIVEHPHTGMAFDPRVSPDGSRVAYVSGGHVHLLEFPAGTAQPGVVRPIIAEDDVSWGVAEFVAAEEMGRHRGYWWAPDSGRLAVCRVDERDVATWYLSDPAIPTAAPRPHRYPAAGTTNADVRLAICTIDGSRRVEVAWDRSRFPYLTRVLWDRDSAGSDRLVIQVQSRDQCRVQVLRVDSERGGTSILIERDSSLWPIALVDGSPAWHGDQLATVEDAGDIGVSGARVLMVAGTRVSPIDMQVRSIVHADADGVLFTASRRDPTSISVWRWTPDRLESLTPSDGVHRASHTASGVVVTSNDLTTRRPQVQLVGARAQPLAVVSADMLVSPSPQFFRIGRRGLRAALLLPEHHDGGRLPVLLDPYGGPHAQRVVQNLAAFAVAQWFANQQMAVLMVDGRGTPGRGPAWERAIHGDLATPVLDDQLTALRALARRCPQADLTRVAIRGWSFGGYLAALAALRAPQRFCAAIVGAPVTDWRLYDTHYTERYLGQPATNSDAYRRSSLVDDDGLITEHARVGAHRPPMQIIHGFADDNVVVAHSLKLSAALRAANWPHEFLPLADASHMTPDSDLTAQLLEVQLSFLRRAFGTAAT